MGDVRGGVREVLAEADHRGLVADGVHGAQGGPDRLRVAHVRPYELHVGRRGHQVQHDRIVAAKTQCGNDVGADEPGSSCDE